MVVIFDHVTFFFFFHVYNIVFVHIASVCVCVCVHIAGATKVTNSNEVKYFLT